MTEPESQLARLMRAMKTIGLDERWATAIVALCGQEIAIKKKLGLLGEEPGEEDFQKIAQRLADKMDEKGDNPPTILLSLARAYPHLRGELVHAGHKTSLGEPDVNSLVTNTSDLITALFPPVTSEDYYSEAKTLLEKINDDEIVSEINGMNGIKKNSIVLSLVQIRGECYAKYENMPDWYVLASKCERLVRLVCKSLGTSELSVLLEAIIERFSLTQPNFVMEVLSEWSNSKSVTDMLKEHLDWIVSTFSRSGSFESAGKNASLVTHLAELMGKEQLEEILNAMDSNDQIRYSWSAQNNLDSFLSWVVGRVDPDLLKRVRGRFRPS